MTDPTPVIDRYIAIWNATDPEDRRDLVAGSWAEDGAYLDPLMQSEGHDGIDAMIAAVQDRFPGFVMIRTGPIDAHNGHVRFNWGLGPAGAEPVVAGLDVGVLADDGRLASITGFLDKVPG